MKKINVLKYIFIIFVVVLIVYSVFFIKKQEKEVNEVQEEETIVEEQETIIKTLRLAAVNIDTLNPILSNNQNIQDISKLIYEPMLTITEDFQIENCLAKEWISLSDTVYVVVRSYSK